MFRSKKVGTACIQYSTCSSFWLANNSFGSFMRGANESDFITLFQNMEYVTSKQYALKYVSRLPSQNRERR